MDNKNEEKKYNPIGLYVYRDGRVEDIKNNLVEPLITSKSGYYYIPKDKIPYFSYRSSFEKEDGIDGFYLHRIVVYSWGDKDGRKYPKSGMGLRCVVDHIDMDHSNNSVDNLQLVSFGINLFRAYYKTGSQSCKERFEKYYNSLDDIDKKILDEEIKLDLAGKY